MSIKDDVKNIQKSDYSTGWAFWNRIKAKRIESLADIAAVENLLAGNLIALEEKNRQAIAARENSKRAKADFELEVKLKIAIYEADIIKKESEKSLIKKATEHGLELRSHQDLLVFEQTEKIRVSSHLQINKSESQIRKTEKTNEHVLELLAYDAKAKIDVEKDYQITMNQVQGIVAVKLIGNKKLEQAQDYILNLIRRRDEIQNSDLLPESKQEALDLINQSIRRAKEAYSYGEPRLLKTGIGQDMEGGNEDTDL